MYDFDKRTLELQNSLKSSAPKESPKKILLRGMMRKYPN